MIAVDPSEAVRSAEIVPVLQRYVEIVEHKPGFFPSFVPTFLRSNVPTFDLADIAGNFAQGEAGQRLLEMLFHIEDTLMAVGALASDFAYIVAAPRR